MHASDIRITTFKSLKRKSKNISTKIHHVILKESDWQSDQSVKNQKTPL